MRRGQLSALLGILVIAFGALGAACNSPGPANRTGAGGEGEGGEGGDMGSGGAGGGSGGKAGGGGGHAGSGTGGATGGSGGSAGASGSGGSGGDAGGSGGSGGASGGAGGNSGGAGGASGGAGGASGGAGGAGGSGTGGMTGACPPPYVEPAMKTCGNTCPRCSGGDPTIEKIYALTPPDGKVKASNQEWKLDSEADDPDSMPVIKASIYKLNGAVYWVSDMDVDCDGRPYPGKCEMSADVSFQPQTAFLGGASAAEVPYIVTPNNFNLGTYGIQGGQVAAIIYGGKIGYAVLGDTGPPSIIGEASYAAAEMMGIPPSAINGGINGRSVTYILFTGPGAVPASKTSRAQTQALGESLLKKFLQSNTP